MIMSHLFLQQIAIIVGIYSLISLGSQFSLPKSAFFIVSGVNGVVGLLFLTTALAQLFKASQNFRSDVRKRVLKKLLCSSERRLVVQYFYSFLPLRSYIGSVNYVDELTPLIMFDFSINQIVSLLMIR